jgi:hypothetical protein
VGWVNKYILACVTTSPFETQYAPEESFSAVLQKDGLTLAESSLTLIADEVPQANVVLEVA